MFMHGEVLQVLYFLIAMGTLYIGGALFYAFRFPERCHPGHFDTIGASHQLFHIFVVLAVITHYIGVIKFYEWRFLQPCPLS